MPELDPELVKGFADTFINRWDAYPKQRVGQREYVTIRASLTQELVTAHLVGGEVTIGAYALSPASMARWVALDADNPQQWSVLQKVQADLSAQGVEGFLEVSRQGGHLWFFTPEVSGSLANRFGKQLAFESGLEDELEVFPKQPRLREGGVGSFVRLPLGFHQVTGKRYHFVYPDGQPLAPTIREQIAILAAPPLVQLDFILAVVERYTQRIEEEQPPQVQNQKKYSPKSVDTSAPLSQQIKEAVSIDEYVERFGGVKLDRDLMGYCPFHDDQHKSFGVDLNSDPPGWHCFACNMGGSIIDFEMQMRRHRGLAHDFSTTLAEMAKVLL